MGYFRKDDYEPDRTRPNLLSTYVARMTHYLQLKNPNIANDEIETFVKNIVRTDMVAPTVEATYHKREGYSEAVEMPLHRFVQEIIADNNLAPAGSCYKPQAKLKSHLYQIISGKVKERNDKKKMYLDFEAQGKKRESDYYNKAQANAKIFNNAIAGGMRIKQFILGSLAGFNAITSTGRMLVKQAYAFIERMVCANIYLPSMSDAISYVLNHAAAVPDDFFGVIEQNGVYIPTVADVTEYITKSVKLYIYRHDFSELESLIAGLTVAQRTYVFYSGCFANLCHYNDAMMREWIDACFVATPLDPERYAQVSIDDIKQVDGDTKICVLSVHYKLLGQKPNSTKWNSIKDAAKNNPEGLKAFIYACQHFKRNFERRVDLIRAIMQINTTFSRLTTQENMARETVLLSDTDSNIFTTQALIEWKCGTIDFTQQAYEMNAITTFIISQSLEHVFGRLSAGFGAQGVDLDKIVMKNEFLYPVAMVSALGKHYLAIATMQEGSILPSPRKDIKGVGFRSSAYPLDVKEGFVDWVTKLFARIQDEHQISAHDILDHIATLETNMYNSLLNKESKYLSTQSVKRKEDYKDEENSPHFYYELWTAVFAPDFGRMTIPNKCFKVPLIGSEKCLKSPIVLQRIKDNYPQIHERLIRFLESNPNRNISHILVPPFKGNLNDFFVDLMDKRAIVSSNMTAYYHVLESAGIGSVDRRSKSLVSDFHDPSKPALT